MQLPMEEKELPPNDSPAGGYLSWFGREEAGANGMP